MAKFPSGIACNYLGKIFRVAIIASLALNLVVLAAFSRGLSIPSWLFAVPVMVAFFALYFARRGHALWLMLGAVILALTVLSYPVTEWDARSIWFFHAKRIFFGEDLYAYLDSYAPWSHNDYPPLVPALAANLALSLGHWNEVFPRLSTLIAALPALFIFAWHLRHSVVFATLIGLVVLLSRSDYSLVGGYMDPLIGLNCAAALLVICSFSDRPAGPLPDPLDEPRSYDYTLLWALLATLPLIKNEGLPIAVILSIIALVLRRFDLRILLIALAAILPWLFLWKFPVLSQAIGNDLMAGHPFDRLSQRITDLSAIVLICKHLLMNLGAPLVFSVIVLLRWRPSIDLIMPTALFASLYTALLIVVYLSTPQDLKWHLATSAGRSFGVISASLLGLLVVSWDRQLTTSRSG